MEHVVPPRDLRAWQNLPISAIAHFRPVIIEDQSQAALQELLEQHPYRHFPVVEEGCLKGVAVRTDIEAAVREGRPPKLEGAITCRPGDLIRDSHGKLIESTTGVVLLTNKDDGVPLAIVTLHDVLRAQLTMSEREDGH